MAVKEEVFQWIISTKSESLAQNIDGVAILYPTFRASEAAADLGIRKEAASTSLSALKSEGLVGNNGTGLWWWTGVTPPEKAERGPRKRATPRPALSAKETVEGTLERVRDQLRSTEDALVGVRDREEELVKIHENLMNEQNVLEIALKSLTDY